MSILRLFLTQIWRKRRLVQRSHRILCGCGLLILMACDTDPQISNHNAQSDFLGCIDTVFVENTCSADDITTSARACTEQRHYAQAAELLVMASAYAFYNTEDTATISDTINNLFAMKLYTLKKYQQTNLLLAINALDKDQIRMQTLCQFLTDSPPASFNQDSVANNKWQQAMAFVYCNKQ